jgi:hypothetical protein
LTKSYKEYQVQAAVFRLREGDRVSPETEIGIDYESGAPIMSDCSGTVAFVGFNAQNHSLMVTVEEDQA